VGLFAEPNSLCLIDELRQNGLRAGLHFATSRKMRTPKVLNHNFWDSYLMLFGKKYEKLYLFMGPANKNTTNYTNKRHFRGVGSNQKT
jgi:hypothetical protein